MDISHRKVSKAIRVVDAAGNPVAGKAVKVAQTNHKFLFGCGAFDSIPATAPDNMGNLAFYTGDGPNKAFYQDRVNKWLDVFNYGTLPFYWGGFEPVEGQPLSEKLE